MAGIYLHIPFCKKACYYCNFHFSTSLQLKDEIIQAIVQEIALQKNYITETVNTVYIGGGTPSLLNLEDLQLLNRALQQNFKLDKDIEFTLEANPDDISPIKIQEWKAAGINRLSIGIQSFRQKDLEWMNRAHNATQALQCIVDAQENGIDNLSIDLIYGTPDLSDADWLENIHIAQNAGISHLSCYALTVEPHTALEKMILQKKKAPVDANKAAAQFELLMSIAADMGFEHYEISNFAKPGYRSKHNSAYWQGKPYLGLGPSAHSYNGISRQWNIANNALYIKSLAQKTLPIETEILTPRQQYNEYIMTRLRTTEGIDLQKTIHDFGYDPLPAALKYIDQQLMEQEHGFLKLTNAGKLRADGIAADLFM